MWSLKAKGTKGPSYTESGREEGSSRGGWGRACCMVEGNPGECVVVETEWGKRSGRRELYQMLFLSPVGQDPRIHHGFNKLKVDVSCGVKNRHDRNGFRITSIRYFFLEFCCVGQQRNRQCLAGGQRSKQGFVSFVLLRLGTLQRTCVLMGISRRSVKHWWWRRERGAIFVKRVGPSVQV